MTPLLIVVAYLLIGLLLSFSGVRAEWRGKMRISPDYTFPPGELLATIFIWVFMWPICLVVAAFCFGVMHGDVPLRAIESALTKLYIPGKGRT